MSSVNWIGVALIGVLLIQTSIQQPLGGNATDTRPTLTVGWFDWVRRLSLLTLVKSIKILQNENISNSSPPEQK